MAKLIHRSSGYSRLNLGGYVIKDVRGKPASDPESVNLFMILDLYRHADLGQLVDMS